MLLLSTSIITHDYVGTEREEKGPNNRMNNYILCIHGRTHNNSNSLYIAIFATQFGGKFGVGIRDYCIVLWVKKKIEHQYRDMYFVGAEFLDAYPHTINNTGYYAGSGSI